MNSSPLYYKQLLSRFIRDELNAEDISILYAFIKDEPDAYEAIMKDPDIIALAESSSKHFQGSLSDEADRELRAHIFSYIQRDNDGIRHLPQPRGISYMWRWRWAAASVILLLAISIYFYLHMSPGTKQRGIAIVAPAEITAPTTNRATITLANGNKVFLDSAGNGQLAQQGNIRLIKLANGQIAYQTADGQLLKELQYNTLTNPRGSRVIDMLLSDGSHVWLNAGSSITYPVAFVGDQRKVELKGEGYFEVAHDRNKKFIVAANGTHTEVLGTHFNVNAYENEKQVKVALLEGAVKVTIEKLSRFQVLKPGEQAQIGETFRLQKVDVNKVIAWKNGFFDLDGLPFTEFMHQLERWYNVEVSFASGMPEIDLFGKIGRDLSLPEVVSSLKDMGVNCKIEQGRLVILK